MSDDATERLELKIAFLERASAELSDVVYAQQREIVNLGPLESTNRTGLPDYARFTRLIWV